jgi:hypothetical protein
VRPAAEERGWGREGGRWRRLRPGLRPFLSPPVQPRRELHHYVHGGLSCCVHGDDRGSQSANGFVKL